MSAKTRNNITISEQRGVRYLHFGTEWIQGAMRLSRPFAIEIDYVRDMMAWLLFLEPPAAILQLGLGAAALSKFCHRFCAPSVIEAVELDSQVVIAARRWFALPPDDDRLRVTIADAHSFVRAREQRARFGVVQVDLYDRQARGPVLDSVAFYRDCKSTLSESGMLCVNLFGEADCFERNRRHLAQVFDERVIYLPPIAEGNIVALAFSGPPLVVSSADLLARANRLKTQFNLPADRWAKAILAGSALLRI